MAMPCQSAADLLNGKFSAVQVVQRFSGFFSEVLRVRCVSCAKEHELAVKVAQSDPERRQIASMQKLFTNEIAFYKSVANQLPSVANFVAAQMDDNFPVLILSWLPGIHRQFLSPASARNVLCGYAELQAHFSNLKAVPSATDTELHNTARVEVFRSSVITMAEDFLSHGYGLVDPRLADWICNQFPSAARRVVDRTVGTTALLHGDFRADNMILGPRGFSFIDWQRWSVGWPAIDVATLLSQSVTFQAESDFINFISSAQSRWPSLDLPVSIHEWCDIILVASFGPIAGYRMSNLTDRELALVRGSAARALNALSIVREIA